MGINGTMAPDVMLRRALLYATSRGCFGAAVLLNAACAMPMHSDSVTPGGTAFVQLPLIPGWYAGRRVHYVTTDASDRDAAKAAGANYAPRLENAIADAAIPGSARRWSESTP